MEQLLSNKVALITGAASGIGKSTAELFARHGAHLILTDIDEEGGNALADALGENAHFLRADVSNSDDAKASVDKAVAAFGGLHIAVNNAGVGGEGGTVADYSVEGWQKVIDINLSGVFYGMKYQIPAMLNSGGGSIINIASILGQVGFAGSPAYVAAKHGVVGLTRSAALEYSKAGVRTNAVGPGFIKTPLLEENLNDEQMEQITQLHPIGRMGEASEVAELILWLASEKASFVTGGYYAVDGAYLAR